LWCADALAGRLAVTGVSRRSGLFIEVEWSLSRSPPTQLLSSKVPAAITAWGGIRTPGWYSMRSRGRRTDDGTTWHHLARGADL